MSFKKFHFILGSKSPRRIDYLKGLNLNFVTLSHEVDEHSNESDPHKYVQEISYKKAIGVLEELKKLQSNSHLEFKKYSNPFIVTGDTTVHLNGKMYGKPRDNQEAKTMLQELSGHTHQVVTAVTLLKVIEDNQGREEIKINNFSVSTDVECIKISEALIDYYVATGDPMDKAGSYGIQGLAETFIKKINGPYSGVVGFPICDFLIKLQEFLAIEVPKNLNWDQIFEKIS